MAYNTPLGATFYPGGSDDFYMPAQPEVISPAPQRIMPEVPENMQHNLANLEQQATGSNRGTPVPQNYPGYASSHQNHDTYGGWDPSQYAQSAGDQGGGQWQNNTNNQSNGYYGQSLPAAPQEVPRFSPFPVLHNPPPNVPPTDEQKEAHLEAARQPVLASQDPENQLAWAQDVLTYVEVAMQNDARLAATRGPRPNTPQIERQLRDDAMNIVNFLADQAHPRAEFIRGMWLEFGKFGYRIDKKEAFLSYSRAAEKGYGRAQYRMGMQFESSNEPLKAIKYYQKGVDMDDSACAYRLGMMTLLGQHGQPLDYERGLQLVYLAASTADENAPQGAYVMGMLQARELPQVNIPDRFLPMNLHDAKINIEKAAFFGFAKAQVKMGAAYELCQLGCDFDPALSLHYNALAARQGEADAEMAISKWFLCGHEGLFEKSEEIAFTYAQRAAQSGLPTAEFALGYFHEIGIYVAVNLNEARVWYEKAAADGNKDASARIEGLSRSKTLSRRDHENIAISRIKSKHVSSRPRQNQSPLPPVSNMVDMPDPSQMRNAQLPQRPSTARPYPSGPAGPTARPPLQSSGYSNPNLRPASAFGINPNIRPASAATTGGMPSPMSGPPRPFSSVENVNAAYGRGGRLPSGPAPSNYRTSPLSPASPSQFDMRSPSVPPKVDIGYTAPPDAHGDRRLRKQGPAPSNLGPGPGRGTPQPQSAPPTKTSYYPPDRTSSRPTPAANPPRAGGNNNYQTPSAKPSTGAAVSKPAAGKPPAHSLPGKGPKTFDEMGVPKTKEEECVCSCQTFNL
ncbi:MAG: hypothetical protein Q9227_001950 [Pyrenula ochraceoflavens]